MKKKVLVLLPVFLNFFNLFSSEIQNLENIFQGEIRTAIPGIPNELVKIIQEYAMMPNFFVLRFEMPKNYDLFDQIKNRNIEPFILTTKGFSELNLAKFYKNSNEIIMPIDPKKGDVKAISLVMKSSDSLNVDTSSFIFKINPGHRYTIRLKPCNDEQNNAKYTSFSAEMSGEEEPKDESKFFCVQEEPLTAEEIWDFSNQMENDGVL